MSNGGVVVEGVGVGVTGAMKSNVKSRVILFRSSYTETSSSNRFITGFLT